MDEKEFDYMNVIPLVDVMLVLLTIVLTTSSFIATGAIPVDLPKASQNFEETMKVQIIEIDSKGIIYLNEQPVSLLGLKNAMKPLPKNIPVLIKADKSLALQIFVDVIDIVKSLGFAKTSLQTERSA
jgi:biopolymer transport protein ExbD